MRSINKVILIGNLTRDPEMRQTPNGQNVVTFGLATNREWVTKDGRKQNSAEFHDLVAWAKLAEICHTYLKKGKLVYVEGYLKTRSWDTQEGTKKFRTEIVVQDMIMLDKRKDDIEDYIPESEHGGHDDYSHAPSNAPAAAPAPSPVSEPKTEETPAAEEKPAEIAKSEPAKEEEPKKEPAKEATPAPAPAAGPAPLDIDSDLGL